MVRLDLIPFLIQIDRMAAYPRTVLDTSDPQVRERIEASERRYAECIATGTSEREARLEAARASAECRRVQLGLSPDPGDSFYMPPGERYRVDPTGRIVAPRKGRRT